MIVQASLKYPMHCDEQRHNGYSERVDRAIARQQAEPELQTPNTGW